MLNAGENSEQQNSHSLVVGMQNGIATLEDNLAVSYIPKHRLSIQSSIYNPRYLSKWFENVCLHKMLHTNVYSNFFHTCQKLESTKMSIIQL